MPLRAIGAGIAVVLVAALLWTPSTAAPAVQVNNLGLRVIPFRIVNNTGRGGNLYLLVQGQATVSGLTEWYYVSNANGDVTRFPAIAPPGTGVGLNLGTASSINVMLPQLAAARIYFSFDVPITVYNTGGGSAPSSPCGWCPADPNYNTYFDWAEFTWLPEPNPNFTTNFGINATQVDMFGFAIFTELTGTNAAGTVGAVKRFGFQNTAARPSIFADLAAAGEPWSKLVIKTGMVPFRVIAPYHGMEVLTVFPPDFLDKYINDVWLRYTAVPLNVTTGEPARAYQGMVDTTTNRLVFKQTSGPSPADPSFAIAKPTTKAAFENAFPTIPCGNTISPQCDRARAVAALLAGAFMRTVLLTSDNLNACKVKSFYQGKPVNVYAKTFHTYAFKHLAYSFGFDDTCEQSSFILLFDPTQLKITLQPFQ